MTKFTVPLREDVSTGNQAIFDKLKSTLGFVPNLYATMAYSETGLGNYLQFQTGKTSLSNKEKEVVNLVASEVNGCRYCQSAHTMVGKMNGLTDGQILEIRGGSASFDSKLDALARLTKEITATKGQPGSGTLDNFFAAGYTKGSLVDVIIAIADKVVMNYLHKITDVPIDFPLAPSLEK
jgi:AhpD family alkylhydroperoxidase